MIRHGLTAREALMAATSTAAEALGLAEHIGTVKLGKLADLLTADGDPFKEPHMHRQQQDLVMLQLGPGAGRAPGKRRHPNRAWPPSPLVHQAATGASQARRMLEAKPPPR